MEAIRRIDINAPSCKSTVYCGEGAFSSLVPRLAADRQTFTVTDSNVYRLYGGMFEEYFKKSGAVYVIPAGEKSKNYSVLLGILKAMLAAGLKRGGTVFAVGGGVVGDIAGLAASLYMRGVHLVQVPTTLLSQVDSSVGGKTAIDLCGVKNIVGTFYQPETVVVDPLFLDTLPAREIRCGLGEIIKYGALSKDIYIKLIENKNSLLSREFLVDITYDCIAHKADVVTRDERESGLRKTLNLGHTTGHAFELYYKRKSHGEFVLIGMYYELYIAVKCGICAPEYAKTLIQLIKKVVKIPAWDDASKACLMAAYDKKNVRAEEVSLMLPAEQGRAEELRLPIQKYAEYIEGCAAELRGLKGEKQ